MTNVKAARNAVWDLEDEVVGSGTFPNKVSTDELEAAIMRIANRYGVDSLALTQRMKSAALNLFQPHPNTTRLVQQLTHLLTPSTRIQYGEGASRPTRRSIVTEAIDNKRIRRTAEDAAKARYAERAWSVDRHWRVTSRILPDASQDWETDVTVSVTINDTMTNRRLRYLVTVDDETCRVRGVASDAY